MLTVQLTAMQPGRRNPRKATWRRQLPEFWEEVPEKRRGSYFECLIGNEQEGVRHVLRQLLRLPAWALRAMTAEQVSTLTSALAWILPRPDCTRIPFPSFTFRGVRYHLPAPKGQNICCLEYPLADEYYLQFYTTGDPAALLLLVAVLCREEQPDRAKALSLGDMRTQIRSRAEAEARAIRLAGLPPYLQYAVLLYFAGLKEYIYKVYKAWLFEDDEVEDDENEEEKDDDDDYQEEPQPAPEPGPAQPDFGWWGIYQEAAEAGLFGTLEQVYQTSFHDVAMWLVRQRIKADDMRRQNLQRNRQHDNLQ